ncbi:MAG TPA: efflux RND transporter periplasmic adaptor subunit [Polyangiaceae bacterium]|nr:efflux RND transporter periplasmic adaptor subunit [Polyangiaceae bacterium]
MSAAQVLDVARPAPSGDVRPRRRQWLRVVRWGALVAALAAAALVLWRAVNRPSKPAVRYETTPVARGLIVAKVTASGTLSALVTVSVGSQVSGRIESLSADFGSEVRKGQVVATIEPSLFKAAVAQARANNGAAVAALARAEAQAVNADRQYARARALQLEGIASRSELDTAEAALGVAKADVVSARWAVSQSQAALDQANLNLRYTRIASPIDGVVISRNVDVGQTVAATLQAPILFTIAQDPTRMQVDTSVPEADIGKIRKGTVVSFQVDAYPGRRFPGTVRQLRDNAQTIQNVVTYDVVIDVDNSERLLKPGMTANVEIVYAEKAEVLRVANAALRYRPAPGDGTNDAKEASFAPDERPVWLLRAGAPVRVPIRPGITDGTWTEIVSGPVQAGDVAISEVVKEGSTP